MRLITKATNPVNAAQSPLSGGTLQLYIIIIMQYRAKAVKKKLNTVVFFYRTMDYVSEEEFVFIRSLGKHDLQNSSIQLLAIIMYLSHFMKYFEIGKN